MQLFSLAASYIHLSWRSSKIQISALRQKCPFLTLARYTHGNKMTGSKIRHETLKFKRKYRAFYQGSWPSATQVCQNLKKRKSGIPAPCIPTTYGMFHGVVHKANNSLWPYMQSQHLFPSMDVLRNQIMCAK